MIRRVGTRKMLSMGVQEAEEEGKLTDAKAKATGGGRGNLATSEAKAGTGAGQGRERPKATGPCGKCGSPAHACADCPHYMGPCDNPACPGCKEEIAWLASIESRQQAAAGGGGGS